jgi:hypothetical protein
MMCFACNFTWEFVISVEVFRLGARGFVKASSSSDISGKKNEWILILKLTDMGPRVFLNTN